MRAALSQILCCVLIIGSFQPMTAHSAPADEFAAYMDRVTSEPQTSKDEIVELTNEINYRALADNDELMQSFTDALTSGDNPVLVQNLALQFEKNEATYIRLLEELVLKAQKNPEILKIAQRNTARLEEEARRKGLPRIEITGRVYEMAIFSLSYISLVYSLRGVAPETYWVASDLITSSHALSVLIMVAAARQGMNLTKSLSAYFKKLKDRRHTAGFLKGFHEWLGGAQRAGDIKQLSVLLQMHRYTIMSPARFARTRDLTNQFYQELLKLKQLGLLGKFQTFLETRQFKGRIKQMLSIMPPDEWNRFNALNPDASAVIKVKNRPSAIRYYHSAHQDVVRWLAASEENSTAKLRSALQNRLDGKLAAEVAFTNRSLYEKVSTHILALGGVAIGGGLALASGVIPGLDPLFPADLLSFIRDPLTHGNLDLITAFYPAFALAFHEFGWLISRTQNPGRARRKRAEVLATLESTLTLIEVVERDLPTYQDRVNYVRDLDGLVNSSESAADFIERIETSAKRETPKLCALKLEAAI